MSFHDRAYYEERARTERSLAATASSVAAEIHLELAMLYEKLAEVKESERPSLTIVSDRRTA